MKKKHKTEREELRFVRESVLLNFLKNNSHIVHEMGHCNVPQSDSHFGYSVMSPYYPYNLHEFMFTRYYPTFSLSKILNMMLQAAQGLDALHTIEFGPFVHADLQPRQFMVTKEYDVLINDFNRGKWLPSKLDGMGRSMVPCTFCGAKSKGRWRAPEEYRRLPLNEKLDIYSLGMVFWSMMSDGAQPMQEITKDQVDQKVPTGYRPLLPKKAPPELQKLIKNCWMHDPQLRPTSTEIVKNLEEMKNVYNHNHSLGKMQLRKLTAFDLIEKGHYTAGIKKDKIKISKFSFEYLISLIDD